VERWTSYSPPATRTSDAIIALDADTGKFRWINQRTRGDITTVSNLEADFGDSPQVYALEDGRTVVSAGQKNGRFSVVKAGDSGALITAVSAFPNCGNFEGIFADSAVANGIVFLNGANCSYASNPPTGEVMAISGDGSRTLWSLIIPAEPVLSGVAVANGVVFFQASGLVSWLYAVEARSGRVLARIQTFPAISGPSVAKGRVYMGAGVELASGIKTPTAILAFGLQ
jgi:polyvinyl alcohol dehydrogenase (cytochrome)